MSTRIIDKNAKTFSTRFSAGRGIPFQVKSGIEISKEMTQYYQKMIFIDISTGKLNNESKKVCDRVGVNPEDLLEKTTEEFEYNARSEQSPITDDIIKMRYNHYENRRRKKLKIVFD